MNLAALTRKLAGLSEIDVVCPRCQAPIGQGCSNARGQVTPHEPRRRAMLELSIELQRAIAWERSLAPVGRGAGLRAPESAEPRP